MLPASESLQGIFFSSVAGRLSRSVSGSDLGFFQIIASALDHGSSEVLHKPFNSGVSVSYSLLFFFFLTFFFRAYGILHFPG